MLKYDTVIGRYIPGSKHSAEHIQQTVDESQVDHLLKHGVLSAKHVNANT